MTTYQQQYYEKRKLLWNPKRKEAYQTNEAYREAVKARNCESRARRRARRAEALAAKLDGVPAKPPIETPTLRGPYTVQTVVKLLACSRQSIRTWEKRVLQDTAGSRGVSGQHRLYTEEDVVALKHWLEETGWASPDEWQKALQHKLDARITGLAREVTIRKGARRRREVTVTWCFFRTGILAKMIGRTVAAVEQMESVGALPATPYRGPRAGRSGYRLYTLAMMQAVLDALSENGGALPRDKWPAFHKTVVAAWKALGVVMAEPL